MHKQRKLWQAFFVASMAAFTLPAFVQAGAGGAGAARGAVAASTEIDNRTERLATRSAYSTLGKAGTSTVTNGGPNSTSYRKVAPVPQSTYAALGTVGTTTATNGGPGFPSYNWEGAKVTLIPQSTYAALGTAGTTTATNGGPGFPGLSQEEPGRLASYGVLLLPNRLH